MKKRVVLQIPAARNLRKLGKDINEARRRRRITIKLLAERAGVSPITIGKIEKGNAETSIGAYVSTLFVVGMVNRIGELADASHDMTGLQLMHEKLPQRVYLPRKGK